MATGPPPTVLTTYPFRLQSIPNLNSLLIPIGIYVYSITYPLIGITSPTTILNSPINSFYPLDTALVLISDNFHSIFLPYPPLLLSSCFFPGVSYLKLSDGTLFTVCSHTFILFRLRKTSAHVESYQLSFRLIICAFHPEISSLFFVRVFYFYSYFVL
jgi:hypothetical protein